jgi:hypothetical protein
MPTTDHDPIDFTFDDDGDLVRKAPKAVPEDPVEKRLQREREAAPFIMFKLPDHGPFHEREKPCPKCMNERTEALSRAGEVRHGSGKVKV